MWQNLNVAVSEGRGHVDPLVSNRLALVVVLIGRKLANLDDARPIKRGLGEGSVERLAAAVVHAKVVAWLITSADIVHHFDAASASRENLVLVSAIVAGL
jgi:hypothetical protein